MMSETDWREILSFSQRELIQADKEKLCESLSWMEADDIELNFTDLKTLFRLAQDILKFKSEQVNNLKGQHETMQRKLNKAKMKNSYTESPVRSSDSILETMNHQEQVIKTNKEILEQLYSDIAELEGKKNKLEEEKNNMDNDSQSSRDALSELNEVAQLENQMSIKNKHLRKLLSDVKVLEDENEKLKDKLIIIKEKLTEATKLIENLTEQLFTLNNECTLLKDALGKCEKSKVHLSLELETARKEIFDKETKRDTMYDEIKSKIQHWKNIAKMKKAEVESLFHENNQLKENLTRVSQTETSQDDKHEEQVKIKELQEKLSQASVQIENSANIIEKLKTENGNLKLLTEESLDYQVNESKNISDENKEKLIMNKMKKKIKSLSIALQEAEEMICNRDKELAEITAQLQLVKSDEGIKSLLEGLKNKKRQLKSRDEGIKSLVQEINALSQNVDNLQLQNEALRIRFNIPRNEDIPKEGVLKKMYETEEKFHKTDKSLKRYQNKLISSDLNNHILKIKCNKLSQLLVDMGCSNNIIEQINRDVGNCDASLDDKEIVINVSSESPPNLSKNCNCQTEMQSFIDENEGLRKGLQEILNFLKDNSTTSSGVLSVQCPSLDAMLQSMEARHSAGWFAPHMSTVMELRAALGGRDALLTALHEARKETYEVMSQLARETKKSSELEKKLQDIESLQESTTKQLIENSSHNKDNIGSTTPNGEFGSWVLFEEDEVYDFCDTNQIDNLMKKRSSSYEDYLKRGLNYFHEKFKSLFEKMTSIVVNTTDQQNQWSIQEEHYKAQIENLKAQLTQKEEEDVSEDSPGLITIPSTSVLERKCSFLEESYKYIRTLNENIKNEMLDNKKVHLVMTLEFETQIQTLMLVIANLFDKLRYSVSMEIFWKQNAALRAAISNYRNILHEKINEDENIDLIKYIDGQKTDIINIIRNDLLSNGTLEESHLKDILSSIHQTWSQEQLKKICTDINEKNNKIKILEIRNRELQDSQAKIIDDSIATETKEEMNIVRGQLKRLAQENKILKDQYQHIGNQLDIALIQLQDRQQRQLSADMEINLLRHQILDLQSTGDSKVIIARLSGEVLVAHLQSSESQKKIERLHASLNKEQQSRIEAEEMLKARQKIFDIYSMRYESKFKYMFEIIQMLRQQYHGSLPLASLENYLNKIEEFNRKTYAANEKLEEIEDLQYNLMTKHSVYEQVLDLSKNKCLEEKDGCPHKLKNIVLENTHSREERHSNEKIKLLEKSREELQNHCTKLENTLVLLNQGFEKPAFNVNLITNNSNKDSLLSLELEDIQSDEESDSRKSRTVTLENPKMLEANEAAKQNVERTVLPDKKHVCVQTSVTHNELQTKSTQTNVNQGIIISEDEINILKTEKDLMKNELKLAQALAKQKSQEATNMISQKMHLETKLEHIQEIIKEKEKSNEMLRKTIEDLKKQCDDLKNYQDTKDKIKNTVEEENKSLLSAMKQLESDKNSIVCEYKELLYKEREIYTQATKDLNAKIMELQSKLDSTESDVVASKAKALKEAIGKYSLKITSLEDKCFKTQSQFDGCKSELTTCQRELERWKDLAIERLAKMEQLNSQLEKRHHDEVESYKAENQHWMAQLNDTQREHMELRSRLSEQKAAHMKQIADKETVIEQLRSAVHGLKTQIVSMQTMISVNDPSFDLSAIVEVDESSDALSQHGSDRLELKFDSSIDIQEMQDDLIRMPASSTAIWQEPVIDRLRREKQMAGKQNTILRRQIKALAARERRARLDAQNLKNQVFRISTSSTKAGSMETAALQNKIASLQTQLSSARRDTQSSVALWDKWKRAQHSSERWQARYDEKCQEVKKIEMSFNLAKSALVRLEKEKRLLLSRLSEVRMEKQEREMPEKSSRMSDSERSLSPPPVSARALLERVQAQQRRIAALEVAEKGNEVLVAEYEKALAEITSLKGQVLKLESTLLESQIRMPIQTTQDSQPEVDYWKSYCDMLKEENVQLNLKVTTTGAAAPSTATQHRVNDLEQTVLTLRGLVSKLQAEQKSPFSSLKRPDSRPGSGRSVTDKNRPKQLDTYRLEIANLKRSIQDKDLLLEKSKEMLQIAAEREDELLRENEFLHRRLEELSSAKGGFLSA